MKKIIIGSLVLSAVFGLAFAKPAKVQKVRVAHTNYYVPYDFVNEKGESDGFEVAVLKEIDKLLPEYEFEYFPTSDDDLLIGVQQGKYDFGTKGVWVTEERKKKYIFPQNPIGASVIGIVIHKLYIQNSKSILIYKYMFVSEISLWGAAIVACVC